MVQLRRVADRARRRVGVATALGVALLGSGQGREAERLGVALVTGVALQLDRDSAGLDPVGEVVRPDRRSIQVAGSDRQDGEDDQGCGDPPGRLVGAGVRPVMIVVGMGVVTVVVGVVISVRVAVLIVMLPGRRPSGGAEERQVGGAGHVRGRHRGPDQSDVIEERVPVVVGVVDDLVLREEAREERDTAQGRGGDHPGAGGDRHLPPQPAHVLLHVEGVVRARVTDRPGREEQAALEEGVGEDVEDGRQPGADPEAEHHVAELGHRRVGQHLLDVVLHEGQPGGVDDRDRPDDGDQVDVGAADVEAGVEDRIEPRHQEHTGDDHRRRVQERGHRGRARHGVGEPGVEGELTRLADAGDEQCHSAPEQHAARGLPRHRPAGDRLDGETVRAVLDRPLVGPEEDDRRTDEQAHVADPDGEERLERGPRVGRLLPPVTDQHERAETHDLPAEDQLDHVLGEDHHQHARREQGESGEEVRVAAVAGDVLGGEDLHQQRDERDQQQQHDGEPVDVLAEAELEATGLPPGPGSDHRLDVGLAALSALARGGEHTAGEAEDAAEGVLTGGPVGRADPLDPLDGRADRDDERQGHRGDTHLAAPLGQSTTETDDDREADRRDQRDQEGVLEEPSRGERRSQHHPRISESSSRAIDRRFR